MKIFGIRNKETQSPLRISIFSNADGEYCNECGARFEVSDYDTTLYTTTKREIAESALQSNPNWFNASLNHPEWPSKFNAEDYEIFELISKIA